jgi:methionine aminotransferase
MNAMNIDSKLPQVGLTIFSEITRLALQHGVINLSQGFPDFDTHAKLKDLVAKYLGAGYNQYASMQGVWSLWVAIAEKTRHMYGAVYDPETDGT